MESCIVVLARIFTMSEQLKDGTPDTAWRLLPSRNRREVVSGIRHAVEHADRDIMRFGAGESPVPLFIQARRSGLDLDRFSLTWPELAQCVQDIVRFARVLVLDGPATPRQG